MEGPSFWGAEVLVSTKSPEEQLASFLAKFTPEIESLAHAILLKMRARYPSALELVYDNYNALAIGFGPSERVSETTFSIAVYPKWVSLFFLQANRGLPDPENLLKGSGNVVRHIRLPSAAALDEQRTIVALGPDWRQSLRRSGATAVLAARDSALATLLGLSPGWRVAERDGQHVLYERLAR